MPEPIDSNGVEKWLIFSYASNVDGMACAEHLDDRLPHLRALGITPFLVSGLSGPARRPPLPGGRHCALGHPV